MHNYAKARLFSSIVATATLKMWPIILSSSTIFFVRGIDIPPYLQPMLLLNVLALIVIFSRLIFIKKLFFILSVIISLFTLLLFQAFLIGLEYGLLNEVGRLILPLIATLNVALYYLKFAQNKSDFLRKFIKTLIIYLLLDTLWRLAENGALLPTNNRYDLKVGGLIYIDSNFNGFLSACIYLYCRSLSVFSKGSIFNVILILLIFYSFSLAVYIGILLSVSFHFAIKTRILLLPGTIIFLAVVFYIYNTISEDGSFLTKVKIAEFFVTDFLGSNVSLMLTGIGSGNIINYIGKASHSFPGLFAENGVIFTFFVVWVLYQVVRTPELFEMGTFIVVVGLVSLYPVAYMAPIYSIIVMHLYGSGNEAVAYKKSESVKIA